MTAFFGFMQLMGTPALGAVGDRAGKGQVLKACILCSTCVQIFYGLAPQFWQLVLVRGFDGFFNTLAMCQTIIAEDTDPDERVGKMARLSVAIGVGFVLGPGLAFLLAPR